MKIDNNSIHSKTLEIEFGNEGNNSKVMMTICGNKIKGMILGKYHWVYEERAQAKAQTQIKKRSSTWYISAIVMLRTNLRAASTRFLETVVIELLSCGAAEDVMLEYFECWLKTDTLMNDALKRIVSHPLFIRPLAGFFNEHLSATNDELGLTYL